jgi:Tol biopolymer transport system component
MEGLVCPASGQGRDAMDKPQPFWHFLLEISAIAIFVIAMYGILQFFNARLRPVSPVGATDTALSPLAGSGTKGQVVVESSPYPPPYPPPGSETLPPPYPDVVQALYSKASLLAGVKAAALAQGNIWLVQGDRQPEVLVDSGDIVVIFGWSYDGSKLLFGRGLYPTYGDLSDTTEIWVYDNASGETRRLVDSQKVWSASWSPVDDRVAYCEFGNVLTVVSLNGNLLNQHEDILCDFNWSPDGSVIAVRYTAPDMVLSDGVRTNVLTLWWLEKDDFQFLSDAKFEDHSKPLWSIDGQHILFYRIFSERSEGGVEGFYIVDIASGEMTYLQNSPQYYPDHQSRSPRADALVFNLGEEIYMMEFDGKPILIGKGGPPTWLDDGVMIIYRGEDGMLNTVTVSIKTTDRTIGGWQSSPGIRIHPDFYFAQEGIP